MHKYIIDLRTHKGIIWNVNDVLTSFPLKNDDFNKWKNTKEYNTQWIDKFIYTGYKKYGNNFVNHLNGKFASIFFDEQKSSLFITRDWLGEIPLHYLVTSEGIYIANSISDIKKATKDKYDYHYIKSFPHSTLQIFDLSSVSSINFENSIRPLPPKLYMNFEEEVLGFQRNMPIIKKNYFSSIKNHIYDSTQKRASLYKGKVNLLLSGGLDSLTIAVVLKKLKIKFEAYTLSTGNEEGDVSKAISIAKQLNIKHHIINLSKNEIKDSFIEAVKVSESYHLFNVYCAVGMLLLGKKLKEQGVEMAFSGEAVNEAVGDYTNWEVFHPIEKKNVVLQNIDQNRIKKTSERTMYVWGNMINNSKYNRQLGSGLAKHAGARMIKPFQYNNIELENPYYDLSVLGRIVALSENVIKSIGNKPGLMWEIFKKDFIELGITRDQINNTAKVRLQDNTENGEYGITSILLKQGYDQKKAIEIYNEIFEASLNVEKDTKRLMNY